jgi:hypothetical protein
VQHRLLVQVVARRAPSARRVGGYADRVDALALLAESKIRAAMAEGKFDDLPGRGRPLPPDGMARVRSELRMGYRLLRNAGCLPRELEARKEVARLGSLIAATGDPAERTRLSHLRADAELRYQLLHERARR